MKSFSESVNSHREAFIREYGEKKYRQISSKIFNSKKIKKLIELSQINHITPDVHDYLNCINEIPYFIFSKPDKVSMGAIVALELWHNTLNSDYSMLEEYLLNAYLFGIKSDCQNYKR